MTGGLLKGWLAVCGLKREAAIWGGRAVIGGGRGDLLTEKLAATIEAERPVGVISFGVAGALQPTLPIGTIFIAGAVVTETGERFRSSRAVAYDVTRLLLPASLKTPTSVTRGRVLGSDKVIADLASKLALSQTASIVDMESHIAARAAAARNLPLAVIRVVSDAAGDAIPPAATAGLRSDGGVDVGAVINGLARDPRQLVALLRMGRNATFAFSTLARVAEALR